MRYQEVEFAVPLGELVLVVERLLGMSQHPPHVLEISPRRMQHGKARGERLDGEAGLDELERTYLIDKLARLSRSRRCRAEKGPAAEPARHEPCLFELIERAPHGASRSLESRR